MYVHVYIHTYTRNFKLMSNQKDLAYDSDISYMNLILYISYNAY